uniref:Uncharacterized protein n=1 Tax=Cyanothece sp. (strain PCC 7425 / ATCC 29141) TaxID=395961 RepID=B8HSX0_CYAP4
MSPQLKRWLGCKSDRSRLWDTVELSQHEVNHLQISRLSRIRMGQHRVSGIHGINSPVFHPEPIVVEYDGLLDEARVALHEGMTDQSIFSGAKMFLWLCWLSCQGINPIAVYIRHCKSINGGGLTSTPQ